MTGHTATLREVVSLFYEPEALKATVSDLQGDGFDRAEISILAREGLLEGRPAGNYADSRDAEDDPSAPQQAVVADTDVRQAPTLATSMAAVIAAFAALGITVFSGGAAAAALASAAAAGGGIGAVGYALGRRAGQGAEDYLREQIRHGGVLLWIRARDVEHERRACEILSRHAPTDIHVRDVSVSAEPAQHPLHQ